LIEFARSGEKEQIIFVADEQSGTVWFMAGRRPKEKEQLCLRQ
jgi:hypothetical protein